MISVSSRKTCSSCKRSRSVKNFSTDPRGRMGLDNTCKMCRREKARSRRVRQMNALGREEFLKLERERQRAGCRIRVQRYRARNRAKTNAAVRAWKVRNPDYNSRRRAKVRDQFVEAVDLDELKRIFNYCCGICGKPLAKGKKVEIDHIIPISKGGEHSMGNTQPAHPVCNRRKGASTEITLP